MKVIAIFAALAALAVVSASPDTTAVVQTKEGTLTGVVNSDGTRQWLGVPFAQPPLGDLRWRAPQPVTPWGSIDAFFYKPACYQNNNTFTILNKVSEDCLYLNVYAPPTNKSENLPVMIFFYGGSWAEGAASFLLYDGVEDVHYSDDVIIVTANYRLNEFGFLGSKTLSAEDPSHSSGNMGLLDQRQSMIWVQNNIAAFGGDPDNVMIFGESAGAGSVSCHLVSQKSWPYFQRAGMESGPIADWTAQPMWAAQTKFDFIAKELGCSGTEAQVLACMRAADSMAVHKAGQSAPSALTGDLVWSPTIDGVEILDDPRTLAAQGKLAKVPVLLGTNYDEGTIFLHASHNINATGMLHFVGGIFGEDLAQDILNMYPTSDYSERYPENTNWWILSHIFGDSQMSCAARRTARWLSAATGQDTYLYFFTHELEIIKLFVKFKGVCHGSELPFVFDFKAAFLGAGEHTLSENFVRYWTRFAATGNPNGGSDVEWSAYTMANDFNINLAIPVTQQTGLKSTLCDFWDQHPLSYEQIWNNTSSQ